MECAPVIVLYRQPYGERGIQINVYSEPHGYLSLISPSARGRGSRMRYQTALHPLAISTLSYSLPRNPEALGRLLDVENVEPLGNLTDNMARCAIALFLSELLNILLRNTAPAEELYKFLHSGILLLNDETTNTALFPQAFAVQLAAHLGYAPEGEYSKQTPHFDLSMGSFVPEGPKTPTILAPPYSSALHTLATLGINSPSSTCPKEHRSQLMHSILLYLQIHSEVGLTMKSLPVLTALFE